MRGLQMPREFYIPAHSTKVCDKHSDAVAYIYTDARNKPCARVFYGKQAKPVFSYVFGTEEKRAKFVADAFDGRRKALAQKTETKAKRTAENKLVVGDILNTCWGYDQTNREFFEVIEVKGKFVIIREIAQVREYQGAMHGVCGPQSGQYIGAPMRKLVQWGDHVTIDDVRTAHKWNARTVAGVPVGVPASFSEWA